MNLYAPVALASLGKILINFCQLCDTIKIKLKFEHRVENCFICAVIFPYTWQVDED